MALGGMSRFLEKRGLADGFIIRFDWKNHAQVGKIYVLMVIAGFGGGLLIFLHDGMHIGAPLHFWAGVSIAALFAAGGATGLVMARGGGRGLGLVHAACNLTATLLFILSIITGFIELTE